MAYEKPGKLQLTWEKYNQQTLMPRWQTLELFLDDINETIIKCSKKIRANTLETNEKWQQINKRF